MKLLIRVALALAGAAGVLYWLFSLCGRPFAALRRRISQNKDYKSEK